MTITEWKYVLKGHTPVRCSNLEEWALWFETANRHVAKTDVAPGVNVSTVFLSMDHRWVGGGPPLLFETMIFGGEHDGYQDRYSTWDEAEAGHKKAVALAQESSPENGRE